MICGRQGKNPCLPLAASLEYKVGMIWGGAECIA